MSHKNLTVIMNTVQRYTGKGSYAKPSELTATSGPGTAKIKAGTSSLAQKQLAPPIATKDFLREYPDLIGLPADQLDQALQEILPTQPVSYHELTDGITLLNGLLGQPLPLVDAHLALLIRGELIVGLVCVNLNDELPGEQVPDHLQADDLDSRYLMSRALEAGATQLLLISIINGHRNVLETEELAFINALGQTLELVDVDLIDWLVMSDEQNISWLTTQSSDEPSSSTDESAVDLVATKSEPVPERISSAIESTINLTLGVRESSGQLSEAELVYWALEDSKQSYKKTLLDEDSGQDEIEEADWHFSKMQELQNALFTQVAALASDLTKAVTGTRHG